LTTLSPLFPSSFQAKKSTASKNHISLIRYASAHLRPRSEELGSTRAKFDRLQSEAIAVTELTTEAFLHCGGLLGADIMMDMVRSTKLSFPKVRFIIWRTLTLVVLAAAAPPARAGHAYQVATISSLLAGGYDGNTTVDEVLRHGDFGLGTFNGVDGEMMVLDGRVYRGTTDGRAHLVVARSERTPFAVVVDFHPQGSMPVATGQSLEQLQAALDALPYSASRVLAVRIDGRFQSVQIRSEPKQIPPYRPLAEVIKEKQVVNTLTEVDGTLIGFRFPTAASSVNVAGWHFHFLTGGKARGGHVLTLTTGAGRALIEEIFELRIRLPAQAPASSASAEAVKAVEQPR
jgi:acetolactate decarboxylase